MLFVIVGWEAPAVFEFEKRKILDEINKNKTCVNNGTNNLWIKLDDQIPKGYTKGMIAAVDLNGTVWINNGKKMHTS